MKITRRTKLLVVALALCFTTMIGSTFAWFTDSVSSDSNVINAGTLKVDIELLEDNNNWTSLKDKPETKVFNYSLWEPGYTQVETLKIVNEGTLALQYILNIQGGSDAVKGANGENLADVIDVYMAFGQLTITDGASARADFRAAKAAGVDQTVTGNSWWYAGTLSTLMTREQGFTWGTMLPKAEGQDDGVVASGLMRGSCTCTIALHMQEEAGNEYQGLSLGKVGFVLNAKQAVSESDSFGNDYDKDALYPSEVATLEQLKAAIEEGGTISLAADITTNDVLLISKDVTIIGNGNTVTAPSTRLFRVTNSNVNVTFENIVVVSTATQYGVDDVRGISIDTNLSGVSLNLKNCTVKFDPVAADDWAYGVNVSGGNGHTITIEGGTYEGANVINVWGDGHTINIDSATLNCTYGENEVYDGAGVRLEGSNNKVTIKNTTITGIEGNTNGVSQDILCTNNEITVDASCTGITNVQQDTN